MVCTTWPTEDVRTLDTELSGIPGFAYFGVNSDKVENKDDIKWKSFLSDPDHPRIEDVKAPLQVYPYVVPNYMQSRTEDGLDGRTSLAILTLSSSTPTIRVHRTTR